MVLRVILYFLVRLNIFHVGQRYQVMTVGRWDTVLCANTKDLRRFATVDRRSIYVISFARL
jgi:hypothetical protein